jgi:aspartate carbamoyltransferase catalytic subunit
MSTTTRVDAPPALTMLRRKDLLGIADLSPEEITLVLDTAEAMKEIGSRSVKKVPALRGKTVVNLFFEPSTRTRTSFEIAEKRLSADTLNVAIGTSSVVKGESLADTALNLEAMNPDMIVLRHASSGACHLLSRICRSAIINAGDGMHEHPTQALLDAFTIRERRGRLAGLKVAIIGDLMHSRVLRSNLFLLRTMGADLQVCGPPTLVPPGMEKFGATLHTRVETALEGADVIMTLRIQRERQQGGAFPSAREYFNIYGLTRERVRLARKDAIIMHPGPINRGVEIDSAVADGPESVILEQVANGVSVRMAVLYLLAGGSLGELAA